MSTLIRGQKRGHELRRNIGLSALLLALVILVNVAYGDGLKAPENWYVGGSLGASSLQPKTSGQYQLTDDSDMSMELYGGVDLNQSMSLEAYWKDFGKAGIKSATGSGSVDYEAMGVSGIYYVPVPSKTVKPFARLGIASVTTKSKEGYVVRQHKGTVLTAGAGVEYELAPDLHLRTEYNYYSEDLQDISLGFNWSPQAYTQSKTIPAALPITGLTAKPEIRKETITKNLAANTLFKSGGAVLTGPHYEAISGLVDQVRNRKMRVYHIQIIGHTDNQGSRTANQVLSVRRAQSVANYLSSRLGVSLDRMSILGLGETQPLASNATEAGRAKNRRVSVKIIGGVRQP